MLDRRLNVLLVISVSSTLHYFFSPHQIARQRETPPKPRRLWVLGRPYAVTKSPHCRAYITGKPRTVRNRSSGDGVKFQYKAARPGACASHFARYAERETHTLLARIRGIAVTFRLSIYLRNPPPPLFLIPRSDGEVSDNFFSVFFSFFFKSGWCGEDASFTRGLRSPLRKLRSSSFSPIFYLQRTCSQTLNAAIVPLVRPRIADLLFFFLAIFFVISIARIHFVI